LLELWCNKQERGESEFSRICSNWGTLGAGWQISEGAVSDPPFFVASVVHHAVDVGIENKNLQLEG